MDKQVTFAMIKPDAVKDKYTGKIISQIEDSGFDIACMKKVRLSNEVVEKFYEEHKERPFFGEMVEFVTSGPVIAMVLRKENAVQEWRDLIGVTNPVEAAVGTIRSLYGKSVGENAVHGSDSQSSSFREINIIFPGFEIV